MDEARESLAASKSAQQVQQNMLDFYAECGQLRNISVLVLPDFFELKEIMSVARSEILLNVSRETSVVHKDFMGDGVKRPIVMFKRGTFRLYNREAKSMMYDIFRTSRQKNYNCVRPTFPAGSFENQYPLDENKYRKMKEEALARFKERHSKAKENKKDLAKDKLIYEQSKIIEEADILKKKDIAERLGMSSQAYSMMNKKNKLKFDVKAPVDSEEPI